MSEKAASKIHREKSSVSLLIFFGITFRQLAVILIKYLKIFRLFFLNFNWNLLRWEIFWWFFHWAMKYRKKRRKKLIRIFRKWLYQQQDTFLTCLIDWAYQIDFCEKIDFFQFALKCKAFHGILLVIWFYCC